MFRALLFCLLDFVPLLPNGLHRFCFRVTEHMRMPPHEFVGNMLGNFLEIESPSFSGKLAMKNHLQEKIPQFFRHFGIVARFYSVD